MRLLALFLLALAAFGQAIQPTDNPNQINVSTGYLYLNKMHYAGAWSSTTTYNNQDVVTYLGSTYLSNGIGNLGVNPASSTIWWTPIGSGGSSSGTVTSVGISVPSRMSAGGTNPVTTTGTIDIVDNAQNANLVFAGPTSGSAAVPGFRLLGSADLPIVAHTASGSPAAGALAATAVTPGAYTCMNGTVQADGTLTAAASGSCGGGGSNLPTDALGAIASSPTLTASSYSGWTMTLNGAVTLQLTSPQDGQLYSFDITEGSGGGNATTWSTTFSGMPTVLTGSGIETKATCRYYGSLGICKPDGNTSGHIVVAYTSAPSSTSGSGLSTGWFDSTTFEFGNYDGTHSHTTIEQALDCAASNWVRGYGTTTIGQPDCSQPAFTNLSGSVAASQMPALTGDVTTSAGTVAATVVKVNGASVPASASCLGSNSSSQLTSVACGGSSPPAFPADSAQSAGYTVLPADFSSCKVIPFSSGTATVTLLASAPSNGQCVFVENYGSGTITINPNGLNINGGSGSPTIGAGSSTAPTWMLVTSTGSAYLGLPGGTASGGSSSGATNSIQTSSNGSGGFGNVPNATTTDYSILGQTSGNAGTWLSHPTFGIFAPLLPNPKPKLLYTTSIAASTNTSLIDRDTGSAYSLPSGRDLYVFSGTDSTTTTCAMSIVSGGTYTVNNVILNLAAGTVPIPMLLTSSGTGVGANCAATANVFVYAVEFDNTAPITWWTFTGNGSATTATFTSNSGQHAAPLAYEWLDANSSRPQLYCSNSSGSSVTLSSVTATLNGTAGISVVGSGAIANNNNGVRTPGVVLYNGDSETLTFSSAPAAGSGQAYFTCNVVWLNY